MSTINHTSLVKVQEELVWAHSGCGKSPFYDVSQAEAMAYLPSEDGSITARKVESNLLKNGSYRPGYFIYRNMIYPRSGDDAPLPTLADGSQVVAFTIGRQKVRALFSLREGENKDLKVEMIISEPSTAATSTGTGALKVLTWLGDVSLSGTAKTGRTVTFHTDTAGAEGASAIDGVEIHLAEAESALQREVPLSPQEWQGFCLYTEHGASRPIMEGLSSKGSATATYWYPAKELTFVDEPTASSVHRSWRSWLGISS